MKQYYIEYRASQYSHRATVVCAVCKATRQVIAERTHTTKLNNKDAVTSEVQMLAEWEGYTRTHEPTRKKF